MTARRVLGQMIRAKRLDKGLTQQALANEVEVSRAFVAHLEAGDRAASAAVYGKVASVLDFSDAEKAIVLDVASTSVSTPTT